MMVDLVKQDGWIDERKFGLMVVGNYFRDLRGLASLVPLGLRMLAKNKFPLSFHRSAGAETVKALIEAVQHQPE
jgi:succinate dehydrogenase / fumarate reductase, iron-sulfur subunit